MLSFIQDAMAAVIAKQSNGDSGSNSSAPNNTISTGNNMATEALRNSINIPPTINVLPGKQVMVMVARDVSFQSVYQLVK